MRKFLKFLLFSVLISFCDTLLAGEKTTTFDLGNPSDLTPSYYTATTLSGVINMKSKSDENTYITIYPVGSPNQAGPLYVNGSLTNVIMLNSGSLIQIGASTPHNIIKIKIVCATSSSVLTATYGTLTSEISSDWSTKTFTWTSQDKNVTWYQASFKVTNFSTISKFEITYQDESSDVQNESFEGDGTESSPFIIENEEDLNTLSSNVNSGKDYASQYFVVTNNIELVNTFTPIGKQDYPFKGIFNGQGHSISNLKTDGRTYQGLFGYTDAAVIRDINVDGSISITTGNYVGGIIASANNNTLLVNSSYSGSFGGAAIIGGLVGCLDNTSIIQNCFCKAQMTTYTTQGDIGGLVGMNSGTIENCYYRSTLNCASYDASTTGLISGANFPNSVVKNCFYFKDPTYSVNTLFNECGTCDYATKINCYKFDAWNRLYVGNVLYTGMSMRAILQAWVNNASSNIVKYRSWTDETVPELTEYISPSGLISLINESNENKQIYDLGGRRVKNCQRGILIIKSNMSKTCKVIVK